MNDEKKGFFKRIRPIWRGLDIIRKIILNVVFFVILIYVLNWLLGDTRPVVPESTALVIAPQGNLVDELSPTGPGDIPKQMMGTFQGEVLLKDLVDAIILAKDDNRVKVLLLDLDGLGGSGLTKLQDLKDAVADFKKSGKKVIAAADNYNRNAYYLAANADEIYLHHMGIVILEGYSHYVRYFKEGLDRLEVDMHIFRVGKYKSFVEPFMRTNMSDEAREANTRFLEVLWDNYMKDVAAARGIKEEQLRQYSDQFVNRLRDENGDTAKMALKAGLVDFIESRDKVRDRMIELVGENKATHSFYSIGYKNYLAAAAGDRWGDSVSGDAVGVVVAKGTILNGTQPPGTIGGDSTAALLRQARNDEHIKAIVLKVDSGGGSAFASEVIRREMELARKEGKPVVVSMGSVAASGGYWISMASDEVWAYPTTITGSIGILAMFPTYQKPLAKYLGIYVDGVGTNKLAGAGRPDRELDPEFAQAIQLVINNGYDDFITHVAAARKMTKEQVHEVAQGRVWSGFDAMEKGLVDHLGTFDEALKSAAKLAKLGENFKVKYIRKGLTFKERLMARFLSKAAVREEAPVTGLLAGQTMNPITGILRLLVKQVETLSRFNDPNGVYAYCMYVVE